MRRYEINAEGINSFLADLVQLLINTGQPATIPITENEGDSYTAAMFMLPRTHTNAYLIAVAVFPIIIISAVYKESPLS